MNLAIKVLLSGLLVYSALEDLRIREVPYPAGIGLMLFGAFTLIWDQHWLIVAFYLSAVIGSKGGYWGLLPVVLGLMTLAVPGLFGEAFPFILAILFVNLMFGFGAFGPGDAVLAFGLLALAYENRLWMPLVLLATSLLGVIPLVWKRGPKEIWDRAVKIISNFGKIEEDDEAVLFPWAVIAGVVGLFYIWFVRGEIL